MAFMGCQDARLMESANLTPVQQFSPQKSCTTFSIGLLEHVQFMLHSKKQ